MEKQSKQVAIIGGGLVGSLAAVYFASEGWDVKVFERRPDIRLEENKNFLGKRSINLALSHRGIEALKNTGLNLHHRVLDKVIPMEGRMIHDLNGNQSSQRYGKEGQNINSVDRGMLNELLLTEALNFDKVEVLFEHQLVSIHLDENELKFLRKDGQFSKFKVDLIIGADGAYSKVRQEIMKKVNMNYSQEYIEHAYCELTIPPQILEDGSAAYKMDPNHLHIWPRNSYMMIALPNLDKSFTCTLFAPKTTFDSIKQESELLELFSKDLGDSIPLIGWNNLSKEYFKNPKNSLMSVKCTPYHYKGKAIILGDAAHCMVPFYGQGMNCGFEDVDILFKLMKKYNVLNGDGSILSREIEKCFDEYSITRSKDAFAICDLALYNYTEMRSSVNNVSYLMRKKLEAFLHHYFPTRIIPLYTMVSFTSLPYSEAWRRWKLQTNIINKVSKALLVALMLGTLYLVRRPLLNRLSLTSNAPPPASASASASEIPLSNWIRSVVNILPKDVKSIVSNSWGGIKQGLGLN